MSQHTPGPWAIRKNIYGSLDLFGDGGSRIVGSQFLLMNQEANARLIAAAPDMLETLRECDAMLASGESDPASMAELLAGIARKVSAILDRIEGTTA